MPCGQDIYLASFLTQLLPVHFIRAHLWTLRPREQSWEHVKGCWKAGFRTVSRPPHPLPGLGSRPRDGLLPTPPRPMAVKPGLIGVVPLPGGRGMCQRHVAEP